MFHTNCFRVLGLPLLIAGLTLVAVPGGASADEDRWQLRVFPAAVDAQGVPGPGYSDGTGVVWNDGDAEAGVVVGFEYRIYRHLGCELGLLAADPEMRVRVNRAGGEYAMTDVVAFLPATVAFNFHLTPDRPFDVYLGPMIAWVLYATESWDHGPGWHHREDRTEQDVAWGANVGFDVHFGDGPWSLSGIVRYLDTTLDLGDREIDYDPTVVGLGFGFRF